MPGVAAVAVKVISLFSDEGAPELIGFSSEHELINSPSANSGRKRLAVDFILNFDKFISKIIFVIKNLGFVISGYCICSHC